MGETFENLLWIGSVHMLFLLTNPFHAHYTYNSFLQQCIKCMQCLQRYSVYNVYRAYIWRDMGWYMGDL